MHLSHFKAGVHHLFPAYPMLKRHNPRPACMVISRDHE